MIHAIIDSKTLFNVKIALNKCLEQIVVNQAAHFIGSEYMWQFFDCFKDYLSRMQDQVDRIFRRPHSSELVTTKKQIGSFLETSLSIATYSSPCLTCQSSERFYITMLTSSTHSGRAIF